MWSLSGMRESLFSSFALNPNSQPSSHNYYHHQDLTLSTFVLTNLYSVHTVYSAQIVLISIVHDIKYTGKTRTLVYIESIWADTSIILFIITIITVVLLLIID